MIKTRSAFCLPNLHQVDEYFDRLLHVSYTDPFFFAVDTLHSGEDIWTRQSHKAQPASVSTTANALPGYFHATFDISLLCILDNLRMFFQHFFHIPVLFLYLKFHPRFW